MAEKSMVLLLFYILNISMLYYVYNNIENVNMYMDEEFHLKQTISFYNNAFKDWDPKLTTFPGTFLITSLFMKILNILHITVNSSTYLKIARLLVAIISITTFILLGKFKNDKPLTKLQILVSILPIIFFYNFLFYTEAFSIFSLILFFYVNFYTKKNKSLSVLLSGSLSVLIRQNNIIWVNLLPLSDCILILENFIDNLNFSILLKNIKNVIVDYFNIVIIDCFFIVFVIENDFSIVLGDKSHHNMNLHLAQLNHFMIFSIVFFPALNFKFFKSISKILKFKNISFRFFITFIIILSLVFIGDKFSYIHDFILSDNRHYVFYYFKKIYMKTILKYALLLYVSFLFSLIVNDNFNLIKDSKIISWFICTFLCIVPSKLVEVRYFAPCYLVFIILINNYHNIYSDIYDLVFHWFNILVHVIINAVTFHVFLFKPFKNKYFSNELSRFMY